MLDNIRRANHLTVQFQSSYTAFYPSRGRALTTVLDDAGLLDSLSYSNLIALWRLPSRDPEIRVDTCLREAVPVCL